MSSPTPQKRRRVNYRAIIPVIIAGLIVFGIIWLIPLATIHNQPAAIGSSPSATSSAGNGVTPVRQLLPIDSFDVLAMTTSPEQYVVAVEGYVPDSCAKAREPVVKRAGSQITITIGMDRPQGAVCAQIATPYKRNIQLGTLPAGSYQIAVNGKTQTLQVK